METVLFYNQRDLMKTTVIGTGHVRSSTGAGLASLDHDVTCNDCIMDKISSLTSIYV